MIARRPQAPEPPIVARWRQAAHQVVNSNSRHQASRTWITTLTKAFFVGRKILTNDSLSRLVTEEPPAGAAVELPGWANGRSRRASASGHWCRSRRKANLGAKTEAADCARK